MAIALVSNISRHGTGTTGSIDTSGASLLTAAVGWTTTSGAFVLTDSKSNVWMPFGGTTATFTSSHLTFYVCFQPTVGSGHTFTIGGASSVCVAAFSGTATAFSFDNGRANDANSTSVQAGSITPSVNNCLVIAAIAYRDTTALSINGGFTITNQEAFISGSAVGSGLAYLVQTTATAANPTWSWTNTALSSSLITAFQSPFSSSGLEVSFPFLGS